MKINEIFGLLKINEAPLPDDWDKTAFSPKMSFKAKVDYAKQRATQLGVGSSRVAFEIEYQGRPTVLKIAKNKKGIAQNQVESELLDDYYVKQLDIVIPMIDYDEDNNSPTWIHTEKADKVSEKKLCSLLKCDELYKFIKTIKGMNTGKENSLEKYAEEMIFWKVISKDDAEIMKNYADSLYELKHNYDVELSDFNRVANWGVYSGKPVIIDIGLNTQVFKLHYS